jgi:hypothetical protein
MTNMRAKPLPEVGAYTEAEKVAIKRYAAVHSTDLSIVSAQVLALVAHRAMTARCQEEGKLFPWGTALFEFMATVNCPPDRIRYDLRHRYRVRILNGEE